jgi:glycosyltransferase involved in cell wall biosynthesis
VRIAVNARFLLPHRLEGFGWYTHEIVRRMAVAHPNDEFVLFFDRKYDPRFVYGPNVTPVVLYPQARHPLLWYWWFEYSVPKALKKYKADVFFSPDSYLSLSTQVPTVMTAHDIVPLHHPEGIPWATRKYYQYYLPKFLNRADHILTVSEYVRQDIAQTCSIDLNKISVVYNGCRDNFSPLQESEKQIVRRDFSKNQPYFFYTGAIHPRKNIPRLLRAFDQFKAKTNAPHLLLLAGRFAWQTGEVTDTHAAMRHRDDVQFLGYVSETDLPRLTAAATALVYVSLSEGFGLPMLEAMCTDTPVIAANASCLPEIAGEAALLIDPLSESVIAEAMKKVVDDAGFAQKLVEKGKAQREKFDWAIAAEKVYEKLASV